MTMDELKAMPVRDAAAENAHLYLWTTNSFVVEAHELARAWGFEPKTMLTWVKMKDDGQPSMKTGYYFRGATEHCLFCVRGSLRLQGEAMPTALLYRRLPHSVKPGRFMDMVEEQSPPPRLEIFARSGGPLFPKRDGWDTWGNELPNDVDFAT